MEEILVADIMTRYPITTKADTNLLECSKKMVRKRTGSLLLMDEKKLVGIITQRDILWAMIKKSKEDLSKILAKEISPKKLATIQPNASLKEAIVKMKKLKFERLPVIQDKQLVGIITAKDILNFHPELFPEIKELASIREESKKIKRYKTAKERPIEFEGLCSECGEQDILKNVDGRMLCESCRRELN